MTPKQRAAIQDRDIAQITSDCTAKRIYLSLHFVTTEFDYLTGRRFATQLLEHLERIAPDGPTTPETERDHQSPASGVRDALEGTWHDLE